MNRQTLYCLTAILVVVAAWLKPSVTADEPKPLAEMPLVTDNSPGRFRFNVIVKRDYLVEYYILDTQTGQVWKGTDRNKAKLISPALNVQN